MTYGTSSASYLATRCLKQLGIDHATEFPIESLIVQTDFYVDDLLTGTNTKDAAIQLRRNITNLFNKFITTRRPRYGGTVQVGYKLKIRIGLLPISELTANGGTVQVGYKLKIRIGLLSMSELTAMTYGPSWLQVEDTYWPSTNIGIDSKDVSERKKETLTLIAQNTYLENQWIFTRYSTLDKLLRVTAI
ncbi:hypothetical protein QE152_g25818 [Popillia japonica]|uniref:Uncharacterized protein n=1 Tax=Popillia japonica TaxID=7064 RepID=A0AAW1K0M2_POPJA